MMKRAALFAVAAMPISAAPAGDLDPPGAPGPTPAAEPRIAVETLPGSATAEHVITQPGSYRLTGNLSAASGEHGIVILAENVTLDLAGFLIEGAGEGSDSAGVWVSEADGLTLLNGNISNFGTGVSLEFVFRGRLADLTISDCSTGIGAFQLNDVRIDGCHVDGVTDGIVLRLTFFCRVRDCLVTVCADTGIRLITSRNNTFESNTITSCVVRSMLVDANSSENLIVRNEFSRNIFANAVGLEILSLSTNIVLSNVAHNNLGANYVGVNQPIVDGATVSSTTGAWANLSF